MLKLMTAALIAFSSMGIAKEGCTIDPLAMEKSGQSSRYSFDVNGREISIDVYEGIVTEIYLDGSDGPAVKAYYQGEKLCFDGAKKCFKVEGDGLMAALKSYIERTVCQKEGE